MMRTMSKMRMTATQTGATIHTSSIPSPVFVTTPVVADNDDDNDDKNGSEYGLDVNF